VAIPEILTFPLGFPRTTVSMESLEDGSSLDMVTDVSSLYLSSHSAMPIGDWDYLSTVVEAYSLSSNPYDVAIVFTTDGLGDKGINDACYLGLQSAKVDFGVNFTYVEPAVISEYEGFIRSYAEHSGYDEPYDLIICVGFDQEVALQTVAGEHTEQKFAIVDMFIDPIVYPNVASLLFAEHEGSALVGAIAGFTTTTDKIGFIGGLDIPLVNKYAAGYFFGANYTNPMIVGDNITIAYTGDWVDTTASQTLADGMYDAGADIVFAAAGRAGLGVFDSVNDKNATSSVPLWCIGLDSPQMYYGTADPNNPVPPTLCLTSMLKRFDVAVYTIIEDWVVDGTWATGFALIYSFNLANDGVGYEVNTNLLTLPPSVISAVETFKALIIAGTITVPDTIYWTLTTTTETTTDMATDMTIAEETTFSTVVAFGNTTHWGFSYSAENSTNSILTTTVYIKESGIMEYFSGSHWSITEQIMIEDVTIKLKPLATTTTTTPNEDTGMTMLFMGGVAVAIGIAAIGGISVMAKKRQPATVSPDAKVLVICPYCGGKTEQGITRCTKCGADL